MSDETLVKRFQEGDEEAFDELVERHRRRVYSLACRLVGAREAEDLAQEVFLAAYRSLGGFRGEALFGTWLYRITVHVCSHYLRRRRVETTELEEEEPDERREGGPEQSALRRGLCDRVRAEIDALPYKLRQRVDLRPHPVAQLASQRRLLRIALPTLV